MAFDIKRKNTRQVRIGEVLVGGGAPISVQSMTNTPTWDIRATVDQIHRLSQAGCEIIRVAVPDQKAAQAITEIRKEIDIPLIADIHFDHRLALGAIRSGADGLRINPGNIGGAKRIRAVVDAASTAGIPIRVGVNAGSLEKELLQQYGGPSTEAMVTSALRHIELLQNFGFRAVKVSLKASDVSRTLDAYRLFSEQSDIPLHLGVTEAGGIIGGIVKSTLGIGMLLAEGIGDTIRVSLTRDPVEEVRVAYEILRALGLRKRGPEIISCPTCGRCEIDLFDIAEKVEKALMFHPKPIKVAIMGCVVNGPGEAKEADIGIAGGKGIGILFKKGEVVRKVPQTQLVKALLEAIQSHDSDQ